MEVHARTAETIAALDRVLATYARGGGSAGEAHTALLAHTDVRDTYNVTLCTALAATTRATQTACAVRTTATQCSTRERCASVAVQCRQPHTCSTSVAVQTNEDATGDDAQLYARALDDVARASDAMARDVQCDVDRHLGALQRRVDALQQRTRHARTALCRMQGARRAAALLCGDECAARGDVCAREADARTRLLRQYAQTTAAAQRELLGLLDECWQVLHE